MERSRKGFEMLHQIPNYSEKRVGPGEMGTAVSLESQEAERALNEMKKWFMNVVARGTKGELEHLYSAIWRIGKTEEVARTSRINKSKD